MIVSFYDKDFNGLQDNASLVIDNNSYSLIKRGVEFDELKCTCEPFTEDIQPTFLVVKNDKGNYIYGCLAGIPTLTAENKTVITGTDLKSMFKSDVLLDFSVPPTTVNALFSNVFNAWLAQVNQTSLSCELVFKDNVGVISLSDLVPTGKGKFNAWSDIFSPYLRYYGLYMVGSLNLVQKKVIFTVGKAMYKDLNIKLWEHGLRDYGKWVADINECQGYVLNTSTGTYTAGYKWILTSNNAITTNPANRDIYPIKRRIILKETDDGAEVTQLLNEANQEALELLCGSLYKEDITLSGIQADFETKFNIYVRRGGGLYKSLPCGELHYDANGLKKVQIGYRFTGLQFLI